MLRASFKNKIKQVTYKPKKKKTAGGIFKDYFNNISEDVDGAVDFFRGKDDEDEKDGKDGKDEK